jgi:glycosyltransferase involved in cell wall biosynthesis
MRLGILTSHPIQYQAPWFRGLTREVDLEVFFACQPNAVQQGDGFGKAFDWDVDLLSGYRSRFLQNRAKIASCSRFGGCDTPEIKSQIRDGHFDAFIVCGWHLKCYWQAVRACHSACVPVLVRGDSQLGTPRSLMKRWAKEILYRVMLRQFSGFLCVGQRNREYLLHFGVPKHRLFFAPHFVDNNWFAAKAAECRGRRSEIRTQWGADDETLVALFVGKFIPEKQIQDFISALGMLKRKRLKMLGVLVGSGPLEPELRILVTKLDAPVHFAGFKNQTELPGYYVSADVLVLPSISETWGLVVNEAMACGTPAIVSDAAGCAPDLIDEGKTGFTFIFGNIPQLTQRLELLYETHQKKHDFTPMLRDKMKTFSIESAVTGTLAGLKTIQFQ